MICVGIKGWGNKVRIRVRTGSYLSKVSESRMGTVRVWWHSWGKVCVEEEKWGGITEMEDQMVGTF